ncbi:MAG: PAC2 family protein, partial [Dermabacter sp.]|nr:PAC2 family protein [Dermabacter sp.]
MLDPTTLFSYERDVDSRSLHASTLVVTLGSFVDSGRVQEKLDEFITDNYPNRIVGTFDSDQ